MTKQKASPSIGKFQADDVEDFGPVRILKVFHKLSHRHPNVGLPVDVYDVQQPVRPWNEHPSVRFGYWEGLKERKLADEVFNIMDGKGIWRHVEIEPILVRDEDGLGEATVVEERQGELLATNP